MRRSKATATKQRACEGKRAHATSRQAAAQRAELIANGAAGAALRVYRCPHCGRYHVGHVPGNQRREYRR